MRHQTIKHHRKNPHRPTGPTTLKWIFVKKRKRFWIRFWGRGSTMLGYGRRASTEPVSCSPSQHRSLSARVITFIKTQFSSRNAIGRQRWSFHDGTLSRTWWSTKNVFFFSIFCWRATSTLFSNFYPPTTTFFTFSFERNMKKLCSAFDRQKLLGTKDWEIELEARKSLIENKHTAFIWKS